jgi:RHS repeat-associated protein
MQERRHPINSCFLLRINFYVSGIKPVRSFSHFLITEATGMSYCLSAFNGERPDSISGHYHLGNGYRAYSPVLGRFTAPDSWSPFRAGGINPYACCAGDPVNRADPSGHFSLGQGISMVLGFVVGIALSALTEGLALGPVLSLLANVAADAAIGAGAELAASGIDDQRVNWDQVGLAAGAGALTGLVFNGAGILSGNRNRPFGGLMMEGGDGAGVGAFRHPRYVGFLSGNAPGFDFLFEDTTETGLRRLNIVTNGGISRGRNPSLIVQTWNANTRSNSSEWYSPALNSDFGRHLLDEHGNPYPVYRFSASHAGTTGYELEAGLPRGSKNFALHFSRSIRSSRIEVSRGNVTLNGEAFQSIHNAAFAVQARGAGNLLDGEHGQQIMDTVAGVFQGQDGVFNMASDEWVTYRRGKLLHR